MRAYGQDTVIVSQMTKNDDQIPSSKENIVSLTIAEEIMAEAAKWLTALGREHVSDEELSAHQNWLNSSESHRVAFDDLSAFVGELSILKELEGIDETVERVDSKNVRLCKLHIDC